MKLQPARLPLQMHCVRWFRRGHETGDLSPWGDTFSAQD